jgi:hypothetical protein
MFEGTSGLGCNLNKCHLTLIRCDEGQIQLALNSFPCQRAHFPVKYLGIPLLVSKLPKIALQPLADRVADRLPAWKGNLMNRSDRLALIKSMLSAIPVHTTIVLWLPPWLCRALEKIMKAFVWCSTDEVRGGMFGGLE